MARAALDDRYRPGQAWASRKLGAGSPATGVDWLLASDELPDFAFEATSAYVHRPPPPVCRGRHPPRSTTAPRSARRGAAGQPARPPRMPNVNMVTCGGRATIPIVYAVSRVVEVPYAEIVASVSSVSAGPGTRANIDEFTRPPARGRGDRRRHPWQGDHHPESGRSADDHARHHLLRDPAEDADRDAITESIHDVGAEIRPTCRVTGCSTGSAVRSALGDQRRLRPREHLRRGRRCRRLPAALCGQPGHHDRRRHQGGRRKMAKEQNWSSGMLTAPDLMASDIFFNTDGDVRITDTSLRDGSTTSGTSSPPARRSARSLRPWMIQVCRSSGDPRRRSRRLLVQPWVLQNPEQG